MKKIFLCCLITLSNLITFAASHGEGEIVNLSLVRNSEWTIETVDFVDFYTKIANTGNAVWAQYKIYFNPPNNQKPIYVYGNFGRQTEIKESPYRIRQINFFSDPVVGIFETERRALELLSKMDNIKKLLVCIEPNFLGESDRLEINVYIVPVSGHQISFSIKLMEMRFHQ